MIGSLSCYFLTLFVCYLAGIILERGWSSAFAFIALVIATFIGWSVGYAIAVVITYLTQEEGFRNDLVLELKIHSPHAKKTLLASDPFLPSVA